MNTVTARAGFVENLNGPLSACRRRLTSFSSAAAVLGNVPYGVAFPTSPAAVTATTIVSLCTSMPMNRVGCSMTLSPVPEAPRQPIRRDPRSLHMTRQGHPFRAAAQGIGGGGRAEVQPSTNGWLQGCGSRAEPWPYLLLLSRTHYPPLPWARNGHEVYSTLAITTALTMRMVFGLGLRQTEGLIGSIIGLLGLELAVPDHSTLSR